MGTSTKIAKRTRPKADQRGSDQPGGKNGRPRSESNKALTLLTDDDPDLPVLPPADENGHYPAIETARVIIARQVIRARKAVGWTQAELAGKAGVRQETISRIETGKHSAGLKTMAKIDGALKRAGV